MLNSDKFQLPNYGKNMMFKRCTVNKLGEPPNKTTGTYERSERSNVR